MPSSPVEEIKARLDIQDIVGQTVQLRRAGRNWKGLCPFHSEKTPSFYVFPETGTWHCFGCGEGGDVFSFLMKRDRLDFADALRELAVRAGVTLARPADTSAQRDQFDRLYRVLEAATLFYQSLLAHPAGRIARDYLDRRGVSEAMRQVFGLGYAPDSPTALQRYLTETGFSAEEMVAAGVVGRSERGDTYDLLRHRVVFPIREAEGRVVALAGRALSDTVQPKYLNTPQTLVFDKSRCLYALDLARPAIRQSGQVVIVEGYLDAIAAHQYGFTNVVATMGTAITEHHLTLLRRGAPEILLALDADPAGQAAALRALEVANHALGREIVPVPTRHGRVAFQAHPISRRQLKVIALDPGSDPDEVLHRDPARWSALVSAAQPVVDFVLDLLERRHDLSSREGLRAAADEGLMAVALLPDPVDRARYLQRLASRLQVDESALAEKLRRLLRSASRTARAPSQIAGEAAQPRGVRQNERLEAYVLALIAAAGPPSAVQLHRADFRHPAFRELNDLLQARPGGADALLAGLDAPELELAWQEVEAQRRGLEGLTEGELQAERERAALELRHRRLFEEHRQVAALVRDDDEVTADRREAWLARLRALSLDLEAIHRLKVQWGRIGSMVPARRRATEVLSG